MWFSSTCSQGMLKLKFVLMYFLLSSYARNEKSTLKRKKISEVQKVFQFLPCQEAWMMMNHPLMMSHPLPASRTLYGGLQLGWSWNTCVEVLAPFTLWQDETLTCTVQSCPEGLTVSDLIKHKHCLHIAPCGRERQTFSCSMVKSTQRVQKYKQQEQDYWIPRTEYLLISEVPGIYSRTSSWKKTSNLLPQSCRNFNDPALDSLWFWKALNFSDGLR